MATHTFTADDNSAESVLPTGQRLHRYQLTAVAASTEDVVRSAGGWLCDRARAGWDVNVLLAHDRDSRALAILGVTALDVGEDLSSALGTVAHSGPLAVSAHLLATDDRIREDVLTLVTRGRTEVTVFGQVWPTEFGRGVDAVEHQLSAAARAFKAHALYAAAVPKSPVSATETLFNLGTESLRPLYVV